MAKATTSDESIARLRSLERLDESPFLRRKPIWLARGGAQSRQPLGDSDESANEKEGSDDGVGSKTHSGTPPLPVEQTLPSYMRAKTRTPDRSRHRRRELPLLVSTPRVPSPDASIATTVTTAAATHHRPPASQRASEGWGKGGNIHAVSNIGQSGGGRQAKDTIVANAHADNGERVKALSSVAGEREGAVSDPRVDRTERLQKTLAQVKIETAKSLKLYRSTSSDSGVTNAVPATWPCILSESRGSPDVGTNVFSGGCNGAGSGHRASHSRGDREEAKETALREMPAPTGYRRSVVPPKTEGRSCVYDHGVRFKQDCTHPDEKKMRWGCAISASCRAASMVCRGGILHTKSNTGNVTRHIKDTHGIVAGKTKKNKKKEETRQAAVSTQQAALLRNPDPGRFMILLFVKTFIIQRFKVLLVVVDKPNSFSTSSTQMRRTSESCVLSLSSAAG